MSTRAPNASALLIIEVQASLFQRATPIYEAGRLLATLSLLADRAHQAGAPAVYIEHANDSNLAEGSAGWQLHPDLQPGGQDLRIRKRQANASADTPLGPELAARGGHGGDQQARHPWLRQVDRPRRPGVGLPRGRGQRRPQ